MKEEWQTKPLGELCEFHRGLTYAKGDEVESSNNIVLRATNIDLTTNLLDLSELRYISDKIVVPDGKKVKKDSLIICTASGSKSHLGKVAYIDEDYDYAFGGFMGMITPKKELVRRYSEAHENLDRAQEIFEKHQDTGNLAQVNETRARVLVAEHRYEEANPVISGVINIFEKGGENALLADALSIQGVVWARLGIYESSIHILHRAIAVAQDSGAFPNAGQAALTLIEEHGASRLSETELYTIYRRADNILKDTQDIEDITRLRSCARIVTRRLAGARLSAKDFSLPKAVLAFEAKFIREALKLEKGSISRAAKRLGVRHQTLTHLLETRHRDLLNLRTPAKPRPRRMLRQAQKRERKTPEK